MFNGRGMFFNSHPRGFLTKTGHFANYGRNQMMMRSNRFGSYRRGSFGSTGFTGIDNSHSFESQVLSVRKCIFIKEKIIILHSKSY